MQKTILVTGGAGYIGSHICQLLSKKGFLPITYDNLSRGYKTAVKWGPLIVGDLKDKTKLQKTFEIYQPVSVMHFAAYAYVGESVENPALYYENNLISTLTLFNVMLEHNVKELIFSSTCATYGVPQKLPLTEDHPQTPINPYGRSKLMIEQMLKDYDKAYGLKSISLRYFNAAGSDLDGEIGENHQPETHLIPLIIKAALGQTSKIAVFGTDFSTKDGSAIRDYIHVMDLARAHLQALLYLQEKKESLFVNLGTGSGFSVLEVIAKVKELTGQEFKVDLQGRRAGDPPILVADSEKALKTLNFKLKYSDLETIIMSAFSWQKKQIKQNVIT